MALTLEQEQFLTHFLKRDGNRRGRFGGKSENEKIRASYEDYLRRRDKVILTINELTVQQGGEDLAAPFSKSLTTITRNVIAASESGNEQAITAAYKDLEAVKKNVRKALDARKKEIEDREKTRESLEKKLQKATSESNPAKKLQKLTELQQEANDWLTSHPAVDAPPMWDIMQQAIQAKGGPDANDVHQATSQFDRESYELLKRTRSVRPENLALANQQSQTPLTDQLEDLMDRMQRFYDKATEEGQQFDSVRLDRMITELRTELQRLDPSRIPTQPSTGSRPSDSTSETQLQDTDSRPSSTDSTQPPQTSTAPVELDPPLTGRELGEKTLRKSDNLIKHFDSEYQRVSTNLREIGTSVEELQQRCAAYQNELADDLSTITRALDTSQHACQRSHAHGERAREELTLGQQQLDDEFEWKLCVKAIGNALDLGLAELAAAEKNLGTVEGGILYVERSLSALESLEQRIRQVDNDMLTTVVQKIALLPQVTNLPTEGIELDLIRQLVFTADLPNNKVTSLLSQPGQGRSDQEKRQKLDAMIKTLISSPKLGTLMMTQALLRCHQIVVDADRYFGSVSAYKNSLSDPQLQQKLATIIDVAKQDVEKYTIPVLDVPSVSGSDSTDTPIVSVGVAIIGGGPIGLLAAIEARMSGASQVHVYEGRQDPYSRMNVLKIDDAALQRLRTAGAYELIYPNGQQPPSGPVASVKTIENALESRAKNLGINLQRGKFLLDVERDRNGKVLLYFQGEDEAKTCDLLIVATGASVASAQKHANNVVLGDRLGIPFQKSEVKDYAAVGLFSKDAPTPDQKSATSGWAYDFETEEVKYLVAQLSEEEYESLIQDPRALRARIAEDGQKVKLASAPTVDLSVRSGPAPSTDESIDESGLSQAIDTAFDSLMNEVRGSNFFGSDADLDEEKSGRAKKRSLDSLTRKVKARESAKVSPADVESAVLSFLNMELGAAAFPIQIQQAERFTGADNTGVLIGDSAATPHPDTAKGLNTGIAEMGAMRDLVRDLATGTGTEQEREQAMQMYEWELKRRTDTMVSAGLNAMQMRGRDRCRKVWFNKLGLALRGLVEQTRRDPVLKKINTELERISVSEEDAKTDTDWSLRENAIREIRDFENQLLAIHQQVETMIQRGETNPDRLMAPIDQYFG